MEFTDIMVDIETLSTKRNAAITQVGLCAFNIKTGYSAAPKAFLVLPDGSAVIDFNTVAWWSKQSEDARAAVFSEDFRASEAAVMTGIDAYVTMNRASSAHIRWWAMPPSFDLSLLEDLAERQGQRVPWAYNATRCLRTLAEIAGATKDDRIQPSVAHDAGADAEAQALSAIKYYQMIYGD